MLSQFSYLSNISILTAKMLSKKHYLGILPILLIVLFVLWKLAQFVDINLYESGQDILSFIDLELTDEEADRLDRDFIPGIEHVTSLTGLWAIRFLLVAFFMTPVSLLAGRSFPLYFRQTIGIAAGFFSLLHALMFVFTEGLFPVFTRFELFFGFLAFLIIMSLTLTSSKKAMKLLKRRWKSLHRLVYLAVFLVVAHLVLLDQSWSIYAMLFGFGFFLRLKPVKKRITRIKSTSK